jgi:anthranilate phosphoribosyltransferase
MAEQVDIKPLLAKLWPADADVSAEEIALAISLFFTNRVSDAQAASLLICLHFTGLDRRGDIVAKCAHVMREAAARIDVQALKGVVEKRGRKEGTYNGGLVSLTDRPTLSRTVLPLASLLRLARSPRVDHHLEHILT